MPPSGPDPFKLTSEPKFDVSINNRVLEIYVLPWLSVILRRRAPAEARLNTSGCAFSTSSKSTTE
jgi:hypothetical protein